MSKRNRQDEYRGYGEKRHRNDNQESNRYGQQQYDSRYPRGGGYGGFSQHSRSWSSGAPFGSNYGPPYGQPPPGPGPGILGQGPHGAPNWHSGQWQRQSNYGPFPGASGFHPSQNIDQHWEHGDEQTAAEEETDPQPSRSKSKEDKSSSKSKKDKKKKGDGDGNEPDCFEVVELTDEESDSDAKDGKKGKKKDRKDVMGYTQPSSSGHKSYYPQARKEVNLDDEDDDDDDDDDEEDPTAAYAGFTPTTRRSRLSTWGDGGGNGRRGGARGDPGDTPSKFNLETTAREVINKIGQNGTLVSSQMIESKVLEHYGAKDLRELGIRYIDDINFVRELLKLQGKVSSYIQAYCSMSTIASYYDLKECLQDFTPETGNFLDLNLGPLNKQPLVYKYFKIPTSTKLPKITGSQVWMHLKDYITEHNLWTGQVDLNQFVKHLQNHYNVPSPLHLGIRVQSLPLAIQMLKKAQKDQGRNLRTAFMQYKMELANDVSRAFQNFKTEILEKTEKGWEVKKFYTQASVPQVTGSIFNKLQILFNAVLYQHDSKWKELRKVSEIVAAFSSRLAEDRLLASLFQLAVSVSSHEFQEDLVKKIFPHMSGKEKTDTSGSEETAKKIVKPSSDDLLTHFDKYIQRCLTHGQLTLEQMSKVEEKICQVYEQDHFGELGHGNFLSYLTTTGPVKELLDELGVSLSDGFSSSGGSKTAYHPSLNDVINLVHQCKADPTVESEQLEDALCSHYHVESVKCLGYGPLKFILLSYDRHQKQGQHGDQHAVFYETAYCANSSLVKSTATQVEGQVGRLGHQSREMALSCLQACPLLENLTDWSQWGLVFQPELGPLKQFIQKHGGCHTVQLQGEPRVLETTPT